MGVARATGLRLPARRSSEARSVSPLPLWGDQTSMIDLEVWPWSRGLEDVALRDVVLRGNVGHHISITFDPDVVGSQRRPGLLRFLYRRAPASPREAPPRK